VADRPEGFAAIQRDTNSLEKWADRSFVKLKKENKALYLGWNNLTHQDRLGAQD